MFEFIDRFADPRFLGNPQLRCAAIWIGTTPDESALIDYLSPDDPGASQFASDVGDVLAEIADTHHLGPEDLAPLREGATRHDSTVANTHIILEQHIYRGAGHDLHGLVFVGNIEYQQPEPSSRQHRF